ncbi:hypothetical protein ACHAWC_011249, partial [Mediolabrus comicus]
MTMTSTRTNRTAIAATLLGLFATIAGTRAQDLCVCSPRKYKVAFDIAQDCQSTDDISGKPGVEDAAQFCSPYVKEVTRVVIKEYNKITGAPIETPFYFDPPVTSGEVEYTSVSNELITGVPLKDQSNLVPVSIYVRLWGNDENGQPVMNYPITSFMHYTNECNGSPINFDNSGLGYVSFTTAEAASDEFCQLPPPDLCVCSPRIYRVAWDTSWENCKNNNIAGLPGIAAASPFCKYNANMKEVYTVTFKEYNIYGIEFKTTEFDMNDYIQPGQRHVRNGYIDYVSVSNELDPSVPLEDQLDRVPRSIKVELLGDAHEYGIYLRHINYSQIIYTNECGTGPINFPNGVNVPDNVFQTTGRLGIFGYNYLEPASEDFCPQLPPLTGTGTGTGTGTVTGQQIIKNQETINNQGSKSGKSGNNQ